MPDFGVLSGIRITDNSIPDAKLQQITTALKVANSATTATAVNTASAIVARDGSGNFSANMISVTGTPTAATDVATKGYVDAFANGIDWKQSVRIASTAQRALSGLTAIDGVTPLANDRILLKNQTAPAENGIWLASAGAWSRATDADADAEVTAGLAMFVSEGTANGNTHWVLTTDDAIVVGTTGLTFAQMSGAGSLTAGAGLTLTGNTVDIVAADTTITVNADSIQVGSNSLANVHINTAAAIAYSKLALTNSIVNADIATGAAIAYAKLNLSASIVNADIAAGAAIEDTKLATITTALKVANSATTATAANTASAIVARDASGNFNANMITLVGSPTAAGDVATKGYVDAFINGIDWKQSVRAATTGNITLSAPQTVDGVSVIAGNRVLVKNQTTALQNGIYVVAAGAWTRAEDANADAEVTAGLSTFVSEGAANGNTQWSLTTDDVIVVGTTPLSFSQIGGPGSVIAGAGLTQTGNTIDIVAANSTITVNADSIQVGSNSLTDTQINSAAAIARSKISKAGSSLADLATRSAADLSSGLLPDARLNRVLHETPTGTINGTNAVFTLANTPVTGSVEVYVDTLRFVQGVHYNVSGTTITFVTNFQPQTGETLRANYWR
jgi:hypothetical protein